MRSSGRRWRQSFPASLCWSRKQASSAGLIWTANCVSTRMWNRGSWSARSPSPLRRAGGALEWVWNVNAYMANDNEITIGAVRADGTEKPEAQVLAGFAAFANKSPQSFTQIEPPAVSMVTSQTLLYSILGGLALDTEKKALRAMAYSTTLRCACCLRIAWRSSALRNWSILPSPQGLTDKAWSELVDYVSRGGTLLVTGPVDRDEHWQPVDHMASLGVSAAMVPLAVRGSVLALAERQVVLRSSFPAERAAIGDMDHAVRRW